MTRLLPFLLLFLARTASAQEAALPHDLSLPDMVGNADVVVKAVLAGLAIASVVTWTVALAKGLELLACSRRARAGLGTLHAARSLEEASKALETARGDCAALVQAAQTELGASAGGIAKKGVKERAAWRLERLVAGAARRMARGTGLLATIGATAPFVGLFGTVWGIMNASSASRARRPPTWPWSPPASPKRCWPPRSAWSPRSPPW